MKQLFRFGIAGSVSFIIDYGLFLILVRLFAVNYALAAAISFTLSVIINWTMNTLWVFDSSRIAKKSIEIIIFVSIAAVGLGINELALWIGIEFFAVRAEISKLIATALVAVWNFVIRKLLLYR